MTTTELFVELIIIGAGSFGAAVLVVLGVFGYRWIPLSQVRSVQVLVGALPVVYVLGIVTDRIADALFKRWSIIIRSSAYPNEDAYHLARAVVYQKSPFRDLFEYSRSRLRIARGWAVNCVLILVGFDVFVGIQLPRATPRLTIAIFGSAVLILLLIGNVGAWMLLTKSEVENIRRQERIVKQL